MKTIAEIIDEDLNFTNLTNISKAISLAYRATQEAALGYIRKACIDHFLFNLANDSFNTALESNRNKSSYHVVLRANRLTMTSHHVKGARKNIIKNALYNKALSSPNLSLFPEDNIEVISDTICAQILHGSGTKLEFLNLVVPDQECKFALYTRYIPVCSEEEIHEEKINDDLQSILQSFNKEADKKDENF